MLGIPKIDTEVDLPISDLSLNDTSLDPNQPLVSEAFQSYLNQLWNSQFQLQLHASHQSEHFSNLNKNNKNSKYITQKLYFNSNKKLGRTVISTRDQPFQRGDILWKEPNPYTFVVVEKHLKLLCSYCLLQLETPLRCANCLSIYYCSKTCQKADWIDHKHECPFLKIRSWPTPAKLILRAMHKKLRESSKTEPGTSQWDMLQELFAHPLTQKEEEQFGLLTYGVNQMLSSDELSQFTPNELMKFYAVLKTNGLSPFSPTQGLEPSAQALYIGTSLVNHSCDPNAVATFDGRCLVLKCFKPIKKGDEVFITYLDPCQLYSIRQTQLFETYHFHCICTRCEKEKLEVMDLTKTLSLETCSMEALEQLEASYSSYSSIHDPRLQDARRNVFYVLKRPGLPLDYSKLYSLAQRLHATYVYHLGPYHPLSVFHELDVLEIMFLWLEAQPPSRASVNKKKKSTQPTLLSLKQKYLTWIPKAELWFTRTQLEQLRAYSLKQGIFEYLEYL